MQATAGENSRGNRGRFFDLVHQSLTWCTSPLLGMNSPRVHTFSRAHHLGSAAPCVRACR